MANDYTTLNTRLQKTLVAYKTDMNKGNVQLARIRLRLIQKLEKEIDIMGMVPTDIN